MYKINPCIADFKLDKESICNLCKKKVLELSAYTEDEVVGLINNTPEGVCGSGSISRMNTAYYLHPFRRFALALVIVFGSSLFVLDANAQDTIVKLQNESLNPVHLETQDKTVISGIITEKETGEFIPFANVWIEVEGQMYGTTTDFDGKFNLNLNNITTSSITVQLNISFIGYAKYVSSPITLIQGNQINAGTIELEEGARLEGDLIIVGSIRTSPISSDPDSHRKTTFKRKDIERIPRND
jgi:hypothetical protein